MGAAHINVSLLIATRNRATLLDKTLSNLAIQRTERGSVELIVVDNGSTDRTSSVLRNYRGEAELISLYEPIAGKSRALNAAMEVARGALVVFTDDDISPTPGWLKSLDQAAGRHEEAQVFCGPIIPDFPLNTPMWLQNHPMASAMFGKFQPRLPEGPLPEPLIPFGGNFAVRLSAARFERFRLDLGPSPTQGPLFNEDTEFVRRFRHWPNHTCYVPSASVRHYISPENLELPRICERAFHLGRGHVAEFCIPELLSSSRARLGVGLDSDPVKRYEKAGLMNFYCGQLFQFHESGNVHFDDALNSALHDIGVQSSSELLGKSARCFYNTFCKARSTAR
jgi:glycosyltransferase involved in cell wall biosynthesis